MSELRAKEEAQKPSAPDLTLNIAKLGPESEWSARGDGLFFVFPETGKGELVYGTSLRPLVAGDVAVLNSMPQCKLRTGPAEELLIWWFSARVEHLVVLLSSLEAALIDRVARQLKNTQIYPASSPLAKSCHRWLAEIPPVLDIEHRGHLARIFSAILASEFKSAQNDPPQPRYSDDHLKRVFDQLSLDDIINLSAEGLAFRFSVSRRHLQRIFLERFGLTFSDLKTEVRMLKAVHLLRDTSATIGSVARKAGFTHMTHFTNHFKRRFGVTPGEWRRRADEGNVSDVETRPRLRKTNPKVKCWLMANGMCPESDAPGAQQTEGEKPCLNQQAPLNQSAE